MLLSKVLSVREIPVQKQFLGNNVSALSKRNYDVNIDRYEKKKINNVSFQANLLEKIKLGVSYNAQTKDLEFGVFSKNAEKINLYIYENPMHDEPVATIPMIKENNKWIAVISDERQKLLGIDVKNKKPVYYGFRAWGPNWKYDKNWTPGSTLGFVSHVDDLGNRFNPNKLLTDPYAKEVTHDPVSSIWNDGTIYATGDANYTRDSGRVAPKSIFILNDKIDTGIKPQHSLKDDVIYEVHIKGFTKLDEKIPQEYRGTYKGAGMKAKYLKELGITMVEFLPLQEFQNSGNYWGYMTNQFFAPDRSYAYDKSPGGPTKEFKEMVKAFHDEGIKVCMDVVYNHSGEGGLYEPNGEKDINTTNLYSLRGLDSTTYYEPSVDRRYFYDITGCGGNMNVAEDATSDLFVAATKYWAEEMGVDAFRHDLAPVLGNKYTEGDFEFAPDDHKTYFAKLRKEIETRTDYKTTGVDLIAEPWGIGVNPAGHYPYDWKEWNDQFRDRIKDIFSKPDNYSFGVFANLFCGQKDFFNGLYTRAINFLACHDGLTLTDYFKKQNLNFTNLTKNIRNSILTLFLSKGTPMILGGDEMLRTQNGEHNPYDKDSPEYYLSWGDLSFDETKQKMVQFTKRAIQFRKDHNALRETKYFNGQDNNNNGLKDITWLDCYGAEIRDGSYMDDKTQGFLGFRIDGTEFNDSAASIYTAINKGGSDIQLHLPENLPGKHWYFIADTSEHSEGFANFIKAGEEQQVPDIHNISPNSMMLFIEK